MRLCLYFAIIFAQSALICTQSDIEVPIGGQCGGIGWSGSTICATGGYCRPIDETYSICEPIPPTPDPTCTPPETTATYWTYSSVTATWPSSVSCNNYVRDEHKRWTCAPSPSGTSTISIAPTSSTTTFTSVSCNNYVRDEQRKRWTCAPGATTTSETYPQVIVTPTITQTA